jgi:hypothetical protein
MDMVVVPRSFTPPRPVTAVVGHTGHNMDKCNSIAVRPVTVMAVDSRKTHIF